MVLLQVDVVFESESTSASSIADALVHHAEAIGAAVLIVSSHSRGFAAEYGKAAAGLVQVPGLLGLGCAKGKARKEGRPSIVGNVNVHARGGPHLSPSWSC